MQDISETHTQGLQMDSNKLL